MMTVKDENEYIDLANIDLDAFSPYGGTFTERLDEYNLYHSQGKAGVPEPENPIYNFLRGNGYIPSIEDARNWSLGVIKNKEITDNISVYDLTPDSEVWFSTQIKDSFDCIAGDLKLLEEQFVGGFDIVKYIQYRSRKDGIDYEYLDEPYYENIDDVLNDVRLEHKNTTERAFKIGFLYHDAWWKARHREAARKHYDMLARNKTNGQNGGDVNARKKIDRYRCLDALALAEIESLTHVSDKEAIRAAKNFARRYDKGRGEKLFQNKGKDLSSQWYSEWLTLFRARIRKT